MSGILALTAWAREHGFRRIFLPDENLKEASVFSGIELIGAAEVAAAGKHNLLIIGSARAGKTMMAKRIPTILPAIDLEETIEVSKMIDNPP